MEDTNIKKWINVWENASLALKKIKMEELRAPDYYDKNREIVNDMLQYAFDNRKENLTSGLVQQQQIFLKVKGNK